MVGTNLDSQKSKIPATLTSLHSLPSSPLLSLFFLLPTNHQSKRRRISNDGMISPMIKLDGKEVVREKNGKKMTAQCSDDEKRRNDLKYKHSYHLQKSLRIKGPQHLFTVAVYVTKCFRCSPKSSKGHFLE